MGKYFSTIYEKQWHYQTKTHQNHIYICIYTQCSKRLKTLLDISSSCESEWIFWNEYELPGITFGRTTDIVSVLIANLEFICKSAPMDITCWKWHFKTNTGILSIEPHEQTSMKFKSKFKEFHLWKSISKCRMENGGHFISAPMC